MPHRAIFLDRDGTIIDDSGYLSDPESVHLLPGVDIAIKSLRGAGYKIIVVTNQSGIARGMLTEATLEEIHSALRNQLADKGAMLDAIYYCPYHPDGSVEKYARESDQRKPEPGMLLLGAEELDLDLTQCWMVGDAGRDVGAGQKAGCKTIRIRPHHEGTPHHGEETLEEFQADFTARNMVEAAKIILQNQTQQSTPSEPDNDNPPELPEPSEPEEVEEAEEETSRPEEDDNRPVFRVENFSGPDRKGLRARVADDSNALQEIHRHVRQIVKREETEEFSLLNVFGGVTQVLAVLFLLVVFWKALGTPQVDEATLWALIAMVFQMMSLTFFTMARKK